MKRETKATANKRAETVTKKRKRSSAVSRMASRAQGPDNGLVGFTTHANEPTKASKQLFRSIAVGATAGRRAAVRPVQPLSAEASALRYLEQALASPHAKSFVRPTLGASRPAGPKPIEAEFKSLGAEVAPLTGTAVVKFRQMFRKIPVYGSLVTVELDDDNSCIGINSSLGQPDGVDHIARVSPLSARAVAAKESGQPENSISGTPRLHYYFHQGDSKWHLAYIIEDVPQKAMHRSPQPKSYAGRGADASKKDFVVDAHTGKLLAALPRTPTMASVRISAKDGRGVKRQVTVERLAPQRQVLNNRTLKVSTHDFEFRDPSRQRRLLPGDRVALPPKPWSPTAVAAHANAEDVATFLRNVLRRDNIDNRGSEMVSSVNCWDRADGNGGPPREWRNAFWNGTQVVYGQVQYPDGSLFSIANMPDVVAHEMFHGVTDFTSRLEYQTQAGALNESYSDIFGVILANFARPISRWTWKIGDGFDGPGTALRDLQDPIRHEQPKHMRNFKPASPPYTHERNDYGWVHENSGIHNFAAFKIMTAKASNRYVFAPKELAQIFYLALTVHLSRTAQFSDSRRAVLQAARSLFRREPPAKLWRRIDAIERGFAAAGIS